LSTSGSASGVIGAVRRLLGTVLALAQTRLEELRLFDALVLGVLACVLLGAGAVLLAIFITALFWQEHRLLTLIVLALVFVGAGVGALLLARRRLRHGTPFAGSLAELSADRDAAHAPDTAEP
jgi:uncharacterized membrane protein YqjE